MQVDHSLRTGMASATAAGSAITKWPIPDTTDPTAEVAQKPQQGTANSLN